MTGERAERVGRLAAVRRWCAVFAPVDVAHLEGFDLVVTGRTEGSGDPCLDDDQIAHLRSRDVLVLAHVPVDAGQRSAGDGAAAPSGGSWAAALVPVAVAAMTGPGRPHDGVYLDGLGELPPDLRTTLVAAVRQAAPSALVVVPGELADTPGADGLGPAGRLPGPPADLPTRTPPAVRGRQRTRIWTGRWS